MADTDERTHPSSRPALPWQVWVAATVLAVLAAGAVLWFAAGSGDDSAAGDSGSLPTIPLTPVEEVAGDPLEIEYTDPDGSTSTLAARIGDRPMVVNFFAEWCTPCVKEMPDFEAVHQELGDRVDFFGLAVNDRPEDTARIVERTGVTYDWSRDIRGDIATAAEVLQLPGTLFIAPDGTIVETHHGALDQGELRDLIEEHLGVVP